jgi:hypothetical protein
MMDQTIGEMLSRHLDGDLDSDEELKLSALLEAEPALGAELEAMRRVRRSVADLASSDEVPPALDSLVEPLMGGRASPVAVRPWARWLATAAAVILGATVIIEVNRRNPGPSTESLARLRTAGSPTEPTERFTLAPLPTSSVPPEQQPLGAADRLLARPAPDIELDDPPPLEVLGPLEKEAAVVFDDEALDFPLDKGAARSSVPAATEDPKKGESFRPAVPGAKSDRDRAPRREEEGAAQETGRGEVFESWDGPPPMGWAQLFVFIDGESAWREFTPSATCKAGRYSVRVVVAGGVVREVRPVGGAASAFPSQRLCAAGLVLNLEIEAVADGEYPAEVVVEPRGSGNQPGR